MPKITGMGIVRVIKSVAISVPTIAYPLGTALPQCLRYCVGVPNTAQRFDPHSRRPARTKDVIQITMTTIHTIRKRRIVTSAKRCQYRKHTDSLTSPIPVTPKSRKASWIFRIISTGASHW